MYGEGKSKGGRRRLDRAATKFVQLFQQRLGVVWRVILDNVLREAALDGIKVLTQFLHDTSTSTPIQR